MPITKLRAPKLQKQRHTISKQLQKSSNIARGAIPTGAKSHTQLNPNSASTQTSSRRRVAKISQ